MSPFAFDFHDADLILRSNSSGQDDSKAISFRVHRCVMSAASPFFETMLSLPQPDGGCSSDVPVIPMTEDYAVLDAILHHIYPLPEPQFDTLDELARDLPRRPVRPTPARTSRRPNPADAPAHERGR